MAEYQVRAAELSDVPSWLLVAKEVEYLFGPMADIPEFQNALIDAIKGRRALCAAPVVSDQSSNIVGGIVMSHDNNSIEWLAVSKRARGTGLGCNLLSAAIDQLDTKRAIRVQTFAKLSSDGVGMAARNLYLAFGFEDKELKEPTPTGVPTVLMEKPPCSKQG